MASLVNALIGEYRIVASLGAGGMGEVYKAVHTHLDRVIAIKVLSPDLADGPALQRFYSEANIQASLNHPGVAEYFGFYEYQGRPCILMEYVDGETLEATMARRGALPSAEAAGILREMAAVVAHFHAQGVVHRDLKASNVKITRAGRVKILDFGIARHQRADHLTRVGAVVGTPQALAPEQVRGEPVGPATDIWQLGVIFYEMLTGQPPFRAATTHETFARILEAEFPPIDRARHAMPPEIERIVARCLDKNPAKRFASAQELYDALEFHPSVPRPERARLVPSRHAIVVAAAVAVTLLLVAAAFVAIRGPHEPADRFADDVSVAASPPAESKTVTVDTMNGVAEVYRDGKLVGSTPYRAQARAGEKVRLILRKPGHEDLPVEFEPSERRTYTFTLEPRKGP